MPAGERRTRSAVSSAIFASRMVVAAGKEREAVWWLCRSRGREDMLGEWVRWWICREWGVARAM